MIAESRELQSYNTIETFEMSLIGAMLSDTSIAMNVSATVGDGLFSSPRNQLVFDILKSAAIAKSPLSIDTAVATIDNAPGSMDCFGMDASLIRQHLNNCVQVCDPPDSWPHYAQQLELSHARRSMMSAMDEGIADAMSASDATEAVSSVLERVINAAGSCKYSSEASTDPFTKYMNEYQNPENSSRVRFPQEALNTVGGYKAPNVIVLSAFTGGYKSWIACDWAIDAATKGKRSRIYSLEMGVDEMYDRFMAIHCGMDHTRLVEQKIDKIDVQMALEEVIKLPIDVVTAKRKPSEILADILSCDHKPDIVVIDHLQLVAVGDNKRTGIDDALSDFKQFAQQHEIVFVIVAQLIRPQDKIVLPEPTLSMLKESSGIEQIADYVVFIHKYIERSFTSEREVFKMWTAKQRNGRPASKFDVEFRGYRMKQV